MLAHAPRQAKAWLIFDVGQNFMSQADIDKWAIPAIVVGLIAAHFITTFLFKRFWPKSGKWAFPDKIHPCPTCGTMPSPFRKPANRRQVLWGGATCEKCGTEFDKFGKSITAEK